MTTYTAKDAGQLLEGSIWNNRERDMIIQFVSMITSMICKLLDNGAGMPRPHKYDVLDKGSFLGWLDLTCEKAKSFHTMSINYRPRYLDPKRQPTYLGNTTAVDKCNKEEIAAIYQLLPQIMNDAVGWFPEIETEFQFFFDAAKRHADN
jgi:hypothetical protein